MGDYAEVKPQEDELKVSGPDYRYVLQITEMLEDTKVHISVVHVQGNLTHTFTYVVAASLIATLHF